MKKQPASILLLFGFILFLTNCTWISSRTAKGSPDQNRIARLMQLRHESFNQRDWDTFYSLHTQALLSAARQLDRDDINARHYHLSDLNIKKINVIGDKAVVELTETISGMKEDMLTQFRMVRHLRFELLRTSDQWQLRYQLATGDESPWTPDSIKP